MLARVAATAAVELTEAVTVVGTEVAAREAERVEGVRIVAYSSSCTVVEVTAVVTAG